jgi:oligosaccharide reducing-end xylanase
MFYAKGPQRGYFAWHTSYSGEKLSPGPASDGEEWFLMSLFFASHRWGDGEGIFNYGEEAQSLLSEMLHKAEEEFHGPVTNMFDPVTKQIVFVPQGVFAKFSDPSYHLPAFYELWARWAAEEDDRLFLSAVVKASREALRKAAHPKTGLMPDYANFDGTPHVSEGHEDFRYDAWRTLSNPALDYSWWAADGWQVDQSNRVLTFLASQRASHGALFKLDGTPIKQPGDETDPGYDPGLLAMAATAGLAADPAIAKPFVQELWDAKIPTGRYRYYNGLLTMLGLLETSGRFRIYVPKTP